MTIPFTCLFVAICLPYVMVAHLAGADPRASAQASLLFVAARAGHAVCYVTDRAALRSACFSVGTGACLWLFGLAASAA